MLDWSNVLVYLVYVDGEWVMLGGVKGVRVSSVGCGKLEVVVEYEFSSGREFNPWCKDKPVELVIEFRDKLADKCHHYRVKNPEVREFKECWERGEVVVIGVVVESANWETETISYEYKCNKV